MATKSKPNNWRDTIPPCLYGSEDRAGSGIDDCNCLSDALLNARTELDLIAEGQDGTARYTKRDVNSIRKWIERWSRNLPEDVRKSLLS